MHYIMEYLVTIFGLAVRRYAGNVQVESRGELFSPDPAILYMPAFDKTRGACALIVTKSLDSLGIIRTGDGEFYVLGPAKRTELDRSGTAARARELHITQERLPAFEEYLRDIPILSIAQFANILSMASKVMTGITVQPESILFGADDAGKGNRAQDPVPYAFSNNDSSDNYRSERLLLTYVQHGDTEALTSVFRRTQFREDFSIGHDGTSNLRNITIVTATLVSRSAILGGVEPQEAFALSDAYIRMAESIDSPQNLYALMSTMVIDFANRAGSSAVPASASPYVAQSLIWIRRHLSQRISTCRVAHDIGLSTSYLSSLFRKEMGKTVTDYINEAKIDEAKTLLATHSMTIRDVSQCMGFASRNYFDKVFRRHCGLTPTQFAGQEK